MRLFVSNFHKIVIVWSLPGFSPHWILYSMISENPISTLLCRIRTDPDTVNFLELFIMFPGKDSSILLRYHPCAVIKTSGDQYRLRQIGLAYDGCHLLTYILYLYFIRTIVYLPEELFDKHQEPTLVRYIPTASFAEYLWLELLCLYITI